MAKKEFETVGTMYLRTPLKVNGVLKKKLPYNYDLLTADDIITADMNRIEDTERVAVIPSSDHATQLQLFALAVSKVDPDIDYTELKRMSGWDALKAASISKGFFTAATDEDGEPEETEDEAGTPHLEPAYPDQTLPTCPEAVQEPCADGEEPTSARRSRK